MSAFFSPTDDKNENNNQFYTVWGKVEDDEPQIAFRYVSGNAKVEVSPRVLFEWPLVKETTSKMIIGGQDLIDVEVQGLFEDEIKFTPITGPFKQIDYPEEWLDQHEKKVYTTKSTYGYGSGYYSYGDKGKTGAKKRNLGKDYSSGSKTFYGSEDYWKEYYEEENGFYQDELDNLEIYPEVYPESITPSEVSPALQLGVQSYLKKIRDKDTETYERFFNN